MENNAKKSPKFYIEEQGELALVGWSPGIKAVSPTARIVMSSYEEAPIPPKGRKVPMLTSLCFTAKEMNWEIDGRIRELKRLKKVLLGLRQIFQIQHQQLQMQILLL